MIDEKLVKDGLKLVLKGLGEEQSPPSVHLPSQKTIRNLDQRTIIKITFGIMISLIIIFTVMINMNVISQNRILFDREKDTAEKLSDTVFTAVRYPMMTGDQEVIQMQFDQYRDLKGIIGMHLLDHTSTIKRSTDKFLIGKKFESKMIADGLQGKKYEGLDITLQGDSKKVFSIIRPIANEKVCYRCHGSSKEYLGLLSIALDWGPIEQDMERTKSANITLSFIALVLISTVVFILLNVFGTVKTKGDGNAFR